MAAVGSVPSNEEGSVPASVAEVLSVSMIAIRVHSVGKGLEARILDVPF